MSARAILCIVFFGCAAEQQQAEPRTAAPDPVRITESSTFQAGPIEASDAELDARLRALTAGWTGSSPIDGDLGAIPPLQWPARRGRCYRTAIVVLSSGSLVGWTRDRGLPFALELRMTRDADEPIDDGEPTDPRHLFDQTHRAIATTEPAICPLHDGTIELAFVQNGSKVTSVGSGTFRARVFDVPIAEAKLRELQLEREEADARWRCVECMRERLECQKTGETGEYKTCEQQFRACLGPKARPCEP